ncbi:MAG: hypothetical protein LW700_02895 [Gemmataceae bacterium]|jgi:hypothetical protein|nr:hypothetical protein [Gemmataceae bacterium]
MEGFVLIWEGNTPEGKRCKGVMRCDGSQDELEARRELICSLGNGPRPVRVRKIASKPVAGTQSS